MEETNYDRAARPAEEASTATSESATAELPNGSEVDEKVSQKTGEQKEPSTTPVDSETGQVLYPRKTYIQKLGIKDKSRPNRMLDIALGGLRGFTYPSVLYAG